MRKRISRAEINLEYNYDEEADIYLVSDPETCEWGSGATEDDAYNEYMARLLVFASYYYDKEESSYSPTIWARIRAARERLGLADGEYY